MKKLYLGIAIFAILICTSGIYAINSGGIDDLTTSVASITNNNPVMDESLSELGIGISLESKAVKGSDFSEDGNVKEFVGEDGKTYITFTDKAGMEHTFAKPAPAKVFIYTDDMTPEERNKLKQEEMEFNKIFNSKEPATWINATTGQVEEHPLTVEYNKWREDHPDEDRSHIIN